MARYEGASLSLLFVIIDTKPQSLLNLRQQCPKLLLLLHTRSTSQSSLWQITDPSKATSLGRDSHRVWRVQFQGSWRGVRPSSCTLTAARYLTAGGAGKSSEGHNAVRC
jgi:hypothetical protein